MPFPSLQERAWGLCRAGTSCPCPLGALKDVRLERTEVPGVHCARDPVTACWNRLGALAWAWVPPSDSWVIRLTAGLTAVSGLYVAPPGTLPASARPSAAVSLPSEGLGPCLCSKRRYLEVRAGQGGWVAASAVGVSQAW